MVATGHVQPAGQFGFLVRAPVYWYLGLGLLVAGIMLARGKGELRAAFAAVSLLGALTITPAVVYGMPHQPSAAKHVDLVQNILQAHSISDSAGIYKAYSGLFSAVAWLCDLSRMNNVMGVATYWPFFIDLLALVGLRFLFGRLTASHYRIWVAITLVILVNSLGMDYFSPQSVGFALGMGAFGLALDWESEGLSENWRIGILTLAGGAMAVTHELSPYVVGGVLAVLVAFRLIRPWYIPATVLIPAGLWAVLHLGDVSHFISLGGLGDLANFRPPKQPAGPSTPGLERLPTVGEGSDALAFGLLILISIAGIGFLRNLRNKSAWAFMISTAVGLVLIAGNAYGNEGIFRAALFGIPWLAAVGTQALPSMRSLWSSTVYGVLVAATVGAYLVSMFALDNANVIRPGDYQSLVAYQHTARPDSYLLNLTFGDEVLPGSIDYPSGINHAVSWQTVITQADAALTKPTVQNADTIAARYFKYAKNNDGKVDELYAIWSAACAQYSVDYGLETIEQAQAWRAALIASPDWKVVYHDDGSYLFRVAPGAFTATKAAKK
jgi:hypothetical protein